jgi:hypothetical protein
MIIGYEIETYDSIFDFVNGSQERNVKLKEIYGVDIENWDFQVTDQEAIEKILDMEKESYIVNFADDRHDGFFQIFKIDNQVATTSAVEPAPEVTKEKATEDKKFLSFGKKFMLKIKNLGKIPVDQKISSTHGKIEEDEEEEEQTITYNKDLRYIN